MAKIPFAAKQHTMNPDRPLLRLYYNCSPLKNTTLIKQSKKSQMPQPTPA